MRTLDWRRVIGLGTALAATSALTGGRMQLAARAITLLLLAVVGVHTLRTRRSPAAGAWQLILVGGVVSVAASVLRSGIGFATDVAYPYPSAADLGTISGYVLMVAGAAGLVRERTAQRRPEHLVDGAMATVSTALVLMSVAFYDYLVDGTEPVADRILTGFYLLLMALIVGLVVRIASGPGERNVSYYLLALATVVLVLSDLLTRFHLADVPWALDVAQSIAPFAFVFLVAAMRHPAAERLSDRPVHSERGLSASRLLLFVIAVVSGPVILLLSLTGQLRVAPGAVLAMWTALALLVLVRMVLMVRAKEQAARREAELRSIASRLATATSLNEVTAAAIDGGLEITSMEARVLLVRLTDAGLVVEARGGDRTELVPGTINRSAVPRAVQSAIAEHRTISLEAVPAIDLRSTTPDWFVVCVPVGDANMGLALLVTARTVFPAEQIHALENLGNQVWLALRGIEAREQLHQRRANRRFRALVENSSDVVLVLAEDQTVAFASPTVRRLLGREETEVVGRGVLTLVHRPDETLVKRVLAAPTSPGGGRVSVEARLVHGSGELRWFEVEARDLTREDEVRGVVVTASDISDRKRAEAQLLRSEARFRLMVQHSSDVVAVVDTNAVITYVSPSVERMLGYTVPEVLGRNIFELLSVTEAERLRGIPLHELDSSTIEVRVQAVDGRVVAVEVAIADLRDQPEVDGVVLNIRDVTDRKALEDDLRHRALHDELTGLPNRLLFVDRTREVSVGARAGESIAVAIIDVDDFKLINDSLGHVVGDGVLLAVGDRVVDVLRHGDVAARLAGDEFAVMLRGVHDRAEVAARLAQVRNAIAAPLQVGENDFRLTVSAGVVVADARGCDAEALLRSADLALSRAKDAGKDRHVFFAEEMEESVTQELEIKIALARAIERNEFVLHYQPIVDLETGRIRGIEALIRWEDPERGMVSPGSFIPVAEETGLIRPIGKWVAAQAAHDLARWRAMGFDLYCSVNVSGRQLDEDGFAESFVTVIRESGVDPTAVVVELTESVLATGGVVEIFERLHAEGMRLALDDFGTGYSAFQYLQSFDIDLIKIDRSFVQALNTEADVGVVEAVLDVAARVGAATVAEGIEEETELRLLRTLGVELGQGYYFSRPVAAPELQQLLVEEQRAGAHTAARS